MRRRAVLLAVVFASIAAGACLSHRGGSGAGSAAVGARPEAENTPTEPGPPNDSGSGDPALAEAVARHLLGVEGDDDAAEDALEQLVELRERYPDDPRVLSYLGSARVLAARRLLLPWEKGRTCKEGLALLHRAVSLASEDPELRFVRAVSTYPLPSFFGRREQCADDLRWVAERWEAAVNTGSMTARMAALALLYHGEICSSRQDTEAARKAWEASVRLCPDDDPGPRALARLNELTDGRKPGE